jgi:hypothetical protein
MSWVTWEPKSTIKTLSCIRRLFVPERDWNQSSQYGYSIYGTSIQIFQTS